MSDYPMPLELLELRQENQRLCKEVKYWRDRTTRNDWYIRTQMKPLVTSSIQQGGRILALVRRCRSLEKKLGLTHKDV